MVRQCIKCILLISLIMLTGCRRKGAPNCCPLGHSSFKKIPVVYGYPSGEGLESEAKGEIILGGCMVGKAKYCFRCEKCGFSSYDDKPSTWFLRTDDINKIESYLHESIVNFPFVETARPTYFVILENREKVRHGLNIRIEGHNHEYTKDDILSYLKKYGLKEISISKQKKTLGIGDELEDALDGSVYITGRIDNQVLNCTLDIRPYVLYLSILLERKGVDNDMTSSKN